jgi:hypothetical protein
MTILRRVSAVPESCEMKRFATPKRLRNTGIDCKMGFHVDVHWIMYLERICVYVKRHVKFICSRFCLLSPVHCCIAMEFYVTRGMFQLKLSIGLFHL